MKLTNKNFIGHELHELITYEVKNNICQVKTVPNFIDIYLNISHYWNDLEDIQNIMRQISINDKISLTLTLSAQTQWIQYFDLRVTILSFKEILEDKN